MGSLLGPPLLILVAGCLGLLVLWRLEASAPTSVQTFRRIARRQGIVVRQPVSERLAAQAPFLRRLQEATDIQRLLAIAGRPETPLAWAFRVLGFSVLGTVALLLLDLVSWAVNGQLSFPVGLCFVFGLVCLALGYVRLRNAARRRQQGLEAAVNNALTELAMLTYTRQMPIETALEDLIAPCQADGHLRRLLQDENWRQLVRFEAVGLPDIDRQVLASHTAIYEAIGARLDVPAFHVLAGSMRRINDKGQMPHEVLTNLARTVADNELAAMLVRSEQARARQALPVGLMVIPLILLLGFPLAVGLAHAFS